MMGLNLIFSSITEADVSGLTDVMTRAFDDDARKHFGTEKGGPPGYDNGEFFREWLFGQKVTVGYKAVLDDRILGAVIVWIFDTGNNYLGVIFVDPQYQDSGVGTRIWAFIEASFPNTKTWQLETPSLATKNHHFYKKCGFRKVGEKPAEGGMPCNSWVFRKVVTPDSNVNHIER
jgi:ribosomal protein S18 acetylase RimI-like enzyme